MRLEVRTSEPRWKCAALAKQHAQRVARSLTAWVALCVSVKHFVSGNTKKQGNDIPAAAFLKLKLLRGGLSSVRFSCLQEYQEYLKVDKLGSEQARRWLGELGRVALRAASLQK